MEREVAPSESVRRNDPKFQFLLADYFIDSLRIPRGREDVTRKESVTLKEALEEARASENILAKLRRLTIRGELKSKEPLDFLQVLYGCGRR